MSDEGAFAYLPAPLDEIAQVAGVQAALLLWERDAGAQVYIPARAPDGHWLVACVGREAANRLGAHFAGARLLIPLLEKSFYKRARAQASQMLAGGASRREVVRATGVHERTVYRVKKRLKNGGGPDGQERLF